MSATDPHFLKLYSQRKVISSGLASRAPVGNHWFCLLCVGEETEAQSQDLCTILDLYSCLPESQALPSDHTKQSMKPPSDAPHSLCFPDSSASHEAVDSFPLKHLPPGILETPLPLPSSLVPQKCRFYSWLSLFLAVPSQATGCASLGPTFPFIRGIMYYYSYIIDEEIEAQRVWGFCFGSQALLVAEWKS